MRKHQQEQVWSRNQSNHGQSATRQLLAIDKPRNMIGMTEAPAWNLTIEGAAAITNMVLTQRQLALA
jgi:hypothetical protein